MLVKDRDEQSRILDLLGIFREYIEKGTIFKTSAILATQITNLERATRQIEAKAKAQARTIKTPIPSTLASTLQPTLLPQPPSTQPPPTRPTAPASYANIASQGANQEWTTISIKAK